MGLFDLEKETIDFRAESNGQTLVRKSSFKKQLRKESRNDFFIDKLDMPNINEVVCIKTSGLSDVGSILRHVEKFEKLDTLHLATWIINRDNIKLLCDLIDSGKLKNVIFLVSTRLKEIKKSDYAYLIEEFLKRPNCHFKISNSHAKCFALKTEKNNYVVIGSGNWTENPRIENYIIHNDVNIYDFHKEWINELCLFQAKK